MYKEKRFYYASLLRNYSYNYVLIRVIHFYLINQMWFQINMIKIDSALFVKPKPKNIYY